LGKTAELLAIVTSAMEADDVEVRIVIPEGFAMVSGIPDWRGSVPRDGKVELHYVIKSVQVGSWTIEASVKCSFGEGSFYTDHDSISLSVSEDSAYIYTTTLSQTGTETPMLPSNNETNNETQPPPPDKQKQRPPPTLWGNETESGELMMFVCPTLVAVEGPVIITYGPVLAQDGRDWVVKVIPTSVSSIKVIGQDALGSVHVYAEVTVVESLPPPTD